MKCLFRILVFCSNVSLIHALKLSAPNFVQGAAGASQAGQSQESNDADTLGVQDDVDSQAGDPFGYESADSLDIINQGSCWAPLPHTDCCTMSYNLAS